MTTATAAVIAAAFGLVGVIVGGVMNLVAAVWQQRHRDRLRARPVARLVMRELGNMQATLHAAAASGGSYQLATPKEWRAGADTLAGVVDGQTWGALEEAYTLARYLHPEGEPLPLRAAFGLRAPDPREISEAIRAAQQQLAGYASLPRDFYIAEAIPHPDAGPH